MNIILISMMNILMKMTLITTLMMWLLVPLSHPQSPTPMTITTLIKLLWRMKNLKESLKSFLKRIEKHKEHFMQVSKLAVKCQKVKVIKFSV